MSGLELIGEGFGLAFELLVDLFDRPAKRNEPGGPKPVPRSEYDDIARKQDHD